MKMSKSIKDYKEAMDNIKISESFYKRTEVLLTELPEVKIEKSSAINGRRISALVMSAAACIICLFGAKLAIDGRRSDIVTETVSEADGGADTEIEAAGGADELIDELEEYEDEIMAESDSFIPDGGAEDAPAESKSTDARPAAAPETNTSAAGTAPADIPSETAATTTAPPPKNDTGKNTTTSEKRVVQGINPYVGSTAAAPSEQDDEDSDEAPAAEMPNPGAIGVNTGGDSVKTTEGDMDYDSEYDEAPPVSAAVTNTQNTQLFSELSLDNITVDITPYFNMDNIKSGEGTVKKSGTEFKPVLDLIANLQNEPSVTRINNGSFTSVFSIRIYDANIGLDFYSIYLTNSSTIVITKHSADGSQIRETYALRSEHYESVRYQLFLLFGTESDYELFKNLIGGK